ncbi:MAG TPA: Trm112 family protein, partial [Polyangiaceae bacterium]
MVETFVCPRCHGALEDVAGGFRCTACGNAYPLVGGIPCMVEDPSLWRALWKSRLDDYLAVIEKRLTSLAAEARAPNLLELTRRRIRHVHDAVASDRKAFLDLFNDIVPSEAAGAPKLLPGADPRTGDTPVIEYTEHLFRDFVWGRAEVESALGLVRRLASEPLGKTGIYGVGTGRLALDVQRELGADRTIGFDIHPLPLLVTSRLLRGEVLELHEYPLAPHSSEETAR